MKRAIKFLRSRRIEVSDNGTITFPLPDGERGISLINELEKVTEGNIFCYTIINDKIEKKYNQ